jgi:hypothetical protein
MLQTISFAVYTLQFDGEVYLRKVSGNYSGDNLNNVSWVDYTSNDATLLSAMFDNKTIFDLNSALLTESSGLGIAFTCQDTKLKLNATGNVNQTNSLYLTKPVANPLIGFLKVLIPILLFECIDLFVFFLGIDSGNSGGSIVDFRNTGNRTTK